MTDPTPVDDIIVTGQRARGPSPFANLQFPSKGLIVGDGQIEEKEDGSGGQDGGSTDETEQCAHPEGRREWNKDAIAKEAIDAFLARAAAFNETNFQYREYGALICEFAGGQLALGPVRDGPFVGPPVGGRGGVPIPPTDCGGGGTPVGFVHSHNTAEARPSVEDFDFLAQLKQYSGANSANLSVYVIADMVDPYTFASSPRITRTRLADRIAAEHPDYVPEWVNPDATRCPGG